MRGGKRKGSGRPIGSTKDKLTKKMTITIYPEEQEKIRILAKNEKKTISRFLIDKALN